MNLLPRFRRSVLEPVPVCRALGAWVAVALAWPGAAAAQQAPGGFAPVAAIAPGDDGESDGTTWTALGGAALGAYAGGVMGTLGSLIPCTRTYAGPACVRPAAIAGAAVGMVSGAAFGADDPHALGDAAVAAGIGAAVGGATLLAVQPFLERWNWGDVAAGAVIGGAIGASGTGAAIGLGAGLAVGGLAWAALPAVEMPEAASIVLFGLAAGSLGGWIVRALDEEGGSGDTGAAAPATIGFRIRTR